MSDSKHELTPLTLRLELGSRPMRPAVAVVLPGAEPRRWFEALEGAGVPWLDLAFFPLPRSRHDVSPCGAFVVVPEQCIHDLPLSVHRYGRRGERLYLPVEAVLRPDVEDTELASLLLQDLGVFHPRAGLVGLASGDGLRAEDLLKRPLRRSASWSLARPGVHVAWRLAGVDVEDPGTIDEIIIRGQDDMASRAPEELPPTDDEQGGLLGSTAHWSRRQIARAVGWLMRGRDAAGKREVSRNMLGRLGHWAEREIAAQANRLRAMRHREVFRLLRMLQDDPDRALRRCRQPLLVGRDQGRRAGGRPGLWRWLRLPGGSPESRSQRPGDRR